MLAERLWREVDEASRSQGRRWFSGRRYLRSEARDRATGYRPCPSGPAALGEEPAQTEPGRSDEDEVASQKPMH
jgi:hypothetical protein